MAKRGRREYVVGVSGAGKPRLQRKPDPGDQSTEVFVAGVLGDLCHNDDVWKGYLRHEKIFGPLTAIRTMSQMLADLRLEIAEKNIVTFPESGEKIHISAGWGSKASKWKFKNAEIGHLLLLAEEISNRLEAARKRLSENPGSQLFCECGCGQFALPGSKYVDWGHGKKHREQLRRLRARLPGSKQSRKRGKSTPTR